MAPIEPEIAGQDRVAVSATRAAYRLYRLGFRPGATVRQHQGIVVRGPGPVPGARAMEGPGTGRRVRMLDAQASEAPRAGR